MIKAEMLNAKRMRLVCGLRQIDVWAGTGITPARLSKAENGKIELEVPERAALESYLRKRWAIRQESEDVIFGDELSVQNAPSSKASRSRLIFNPDGEAV